MLETLWALEEIDDIGHLLALLQQSTSYSPRVAMS
jgi:hypothetical protein